MKKFSLVALLTGAALASAVQPARTLPSDFGMKATSALVDLPPPDLPPPTPDQKPPA